MDDIKVKENKTNYKEEINMTNEKIDASLFDKTLDQIDETLKSLGENIETKPKNSIKKKIYDNETENDEEHTIDNTHLRMEELHSFNSEPLIKKNSTFGFYTYLALIIGIIFATYEVLNISKKFIIFKYPFSEPYIEYFYEVIEILAYVVMNIISFLSNLF